MPEQSRELSRLSTAEALPIIRRLTKVQREVFSRICVNDDSYLAKQTALALQRKGLINYGLVPQGGGLSLYRAEVASIAVHIAWCEWCEEALQRARQKAIQVK
jgi:hypothetical protein